MQILKKRWSYQRWSVIVERVASRFLWRELRERYEQSPFRCLQLLVYRKSFSNYPYLHKQKLLIASFRNDTSYN